MSLFSYAAIALKRAATFRYPLKRNFVKLDSGASFSSAVTKTIHDVNTNVTKDVILFKYENPKFYMYMNIFAVVQYMFWTYLGLFALQNLRDAPVDKSTVTDDTPWYRKINLGENKYKNTLGVVAVIIGTGSLGMIWMYTLKSVRYLILNKGGQNLTFITYAPFGNNRIMKVPIEFVCCKESRKLAKVQLPLKVKNTVMHYMLDMRGEFKNPLLFDCTAGLKRIW
ncbi:transmembrane protein 223 [Pararge aegeria]|uniref:Jg16732 protein n=2 Tax=Pararge aegeria TaxID=116150 RepID=A0A8S4S194_9NEOP|nr:transmembrane protein 223 [Pararge aegeria]CAH2245162.1 jg16732 [Pararge aegeria aegeria]